MTETASAQPAGVTWAARSSGLLADVLTVGRRSLRSLLREPAALGPPLVVPAILFMAAVGSLEVFVEATSDIDYRAFQIPVAIIFAVAHISRAPGLVLDIQTGYLDRMLVTPVRRSTLLLGLMLADVVVAVGLSVLVVLMGLIFGVTFGTGIPGVLAFFGLAIMWSIAFNGFPYTVALRTGSPTAVSASFLLFFPLAFITPTYLPRDLIAGWMQTATSVNPVTYLLEGMRTLLSEGWDGAALAKAVGATGALAAFTFGLAFWSLARRVDTG